MRFRMPVLNEDPATATTLSPGQGGLFSKLEQPIFDPVQYLNDSLPPLTLTSQSAPRQNRVSSLQNTQSETQDFLSKLSTHNIRSSSELTSLTDEILRSGNRLAYEVEVLRRDADSLYELLTDTLKDDITQFVHEEVESVESVDPDHEAAVVKRDPEFIRQLRYYGLIKARLEAVVNVFGQCMKWPIPPSEVSIATSLISVSAPELGVANSAEDDVAREYTQQLRNELMVLMDKDGGGYVGLEAAANKVDQFRSLAEVWKGTLEEKARARVVENLARVIEERKKLLDARSAPARSTTDGTIRSNLQGRAGRIVEGSSSTAAGFFRKLRDDIYLD